MNEDNAASFSITLLSKPTIIYLPSAVAREIQRQQNKPTSESDNTRTNDKQVDHNYDYQKPISHQEKVYHHDVDSRVVSSGRRRQMSDPIPISMTSDDAYVHDERQLHFEQQQLKNQYNNATWKLYRYIRAAKQSLRKHRVQDETRWREEDDEAHTSANSNTTMSAALDQEGVEEKTTLNQDPTESSFYGCDCLPFDLEM